MFIGGGAGMAPMRSHLFHLFHTVKRSEKEHYFSGMVHVRGKKFFYYEQFMDIEKKLPEL